jgi:hypothetical protein
MQSNSVERYQQFVDELIQGFPLIFQRFTVGMRLKPGGIVIEASLIGMRGGFSWLIEDSDDVGQKVTEALDELRSSQYWLRPADTVNLWIANFYRRLVQVRPGFYDTYGVSAEPADASLATVEVRAVARDRVPAAESLYPTLSSPEAAAEDFATRMPATS